MKRKDKPRSSPAFLEGLLDRADEFARREPATATVSAFGAGFLLNLMPLGAIASALAGTAFTFVRPALPFLGLLKACDYCRKESPTSRSDESE
jgi:hypothetical protein